MCLCDVHIVGTLLDPVHDECLILETENVKRHSLNVVNHLSEWREI